MKDILPIPMQCKFEKKESVSSYVLHAGASTNYKIISVFKCLHDFTSLLVKGYKQLHICENEHFKIQYRSISCIFQVMYHGLF